MTIKKGFIFAALMTVSFFTTISCDNNEGYYNLTGFAQGGTWQITLNVDKSVNMSAEQLKAGVDSILLEVDNNLSGYNKASMLSRFNAGDTITPSPMFKEMYRRAVGFYKETKGAVDCAAAPLFDMWGFGFTNDSLPSAAKVEQTLDLCGMDRLVPDMEEVITPDGRLHGSMLIAPAYAANASSALAANTFPKLNYNAVAQGYTCDIIADYLHARGVKDMLINIGGEIYASGLNSSHKGWVLGIDRPEDGNQVSGQKIEAVFATDGGTYGIVTSGNYRKFYLRDGKKYAHTIDPRDGYPVSHQLLSATIITSDATAADAYATYCMVIGLEEAIAFIESNENIEGCLIYEVDGNMQTWTSEGINLR